MSNQRKTGLCGENSQTADKKVICRVVVHGGIKSSRTPEGADSVSRYVGVLRHMTIVALGWCFGALKGSSIKLTWGKQI